MGDDNACDRWDASRCEGTVHCPPRCPRFVDKRGEPWLITPYRPAIREPLIAMYRDFAPGERAQGVPPLDDDRIESWLDRLLDEGCNFVAASNGTVAGHATYTPSDAAEPELAVFIHQEYQNRGLGTELCKHVVATAAAADREALVLEVEPRNHVAIGIYEKLGFERAESSSANDDRRLRADAFRMRNPLTEPTAAATQHPPLLRG